MSSNNQVLGNETLNKMSSEKQKKDPKGDENINTIRDQFMIALSSRLGKI